MNFIVLDNETEIPLYGIVLMQEIKRSGKGVYAKVYRVPAEAWIAFLQIRYARVPQVNTYLKAVESGEGINPEKGALLEAIDQAIDIPEEEFRHGMELLANNDEGEEWKKA